MKASEHGHHIAGTPYTYHHGWIKIDPSALDCHDGCGGKTKGGKYLPGHDAKHVSHLTDAVKNGDISHEDAVASVAHSPKLQAKLSSKLADQGPNYYGSLVIHPMPKDKPDLSKPETATHPAPGETGNTLYETVGEKPDPYTKAVSDYLAETIPHSDEADIEDILSTYNDDQLHAVLAHVNSKPHPTDAEQQVDQHVSEYLGVAPGTYGGHEDEDLSVEEPTDEGLPEEDMQAPASPPSQSDIDDAVTANSFGGALADGSGPGAYLPMSDGYKLAHGTTSDNRNWAAVIAPNGTGSVFTIDPHPDGQAYASQYRNLGMRITYQGDGNVKLEYKQEDGSYINDPGTGGSTTLDALAGRTKVYQLAAQQLKEAKDAEAEKKILDALTKPKPNPNAKPKVPKPKPAAVPAPVPANGVGYAVWNAKNDSHTKLKDAMQSNLPGQPGTSGMAGKWKAHVASRLADKITVDHKALMAAAWLGDEHETQFEAWMDAAEHPENYLYRKDPYGGTVHIDKKGTGSSYKDELTPQVIKEYAASKLVQNWAGTSNDHSIKSLVSQNAAAEEFNLENTFDWHMDDDLAAKVKDATEKHGTAVRAFLRAQYDLTQEDLASHGITHANVMRGMKWSGGYVGQPGSVPNWARGKKTGAVVDTPALRPLSSWTVNQSTADSFSSPGSQYRVILKTEVPASAVLSWPQSGFGCLNEYELVVLAGVGKVKIASAGPGLASLPPVS